MHQCTCTLTHHDNHSGKNCDKRVASNVVYCPECEDKKAREKADTAPDLLTYRPR